MSTVNVGRLTANTKLKVPAYNQAQIDSLSVETGMVVWNTTEEQLQIYYGEWASIAGTFSSAVGSNATATGGSMQEAAGYMVHFFTGTDTFEIEVPESGLLAVAALCLLLFARCQLARHEGSERSNAEDEQVQNAGHDFA